MIRHVPPGQKKFFSGQKLKIYLKNFLNLALILVYYKVKKYQIKHKIVKKSLDIMVFYRFFSLNIVFFGDFNAKIHLIHPLKKILSCCPELGAEVF